MLQIYSAGVLCTTLFILAVLGPVLADKPLLRPGQEFVEKSQNDSYVVFCSSGTEEVTWSSPWGKISPTGRIHVEQKGSLGLALLFDRIEALDRGKYTCTSKSKERSSFELSVVKTSQFVNTPTEHKVNEFQNTVIKCEVVGEPKPSITWQRNGQSVDGTMSGKFVPEAKGLKVINATKGDSGVFTCRALQVGRDDGFIESVDITLKVQHKPEWKDGAGGKVKSLGYVGGETNLTCEALAQPEANYTWYRNGKDVKIQKLNISEILVQDRSILQIFIQDESLYGQYQCQARNHLGTVSRVFELTKGVKPEPPTSLMVVDTTVHDAKLKISSEEEEILGYRVQFVIVKPGKEASWEKPDFQDVMRTDQGFYYIKDLLEDTTYEVRAATRTPSGLSDYSIATVKLRTLKIGQVDGSAVRQAVSVFLPLALSVAALLQTVH